LHRDAALGVFYIGRALVNYNISTEPGARLRIDKWLWAARFFKTRSLATDAVEKGRVQIDGARVKPSKDVRVGDAVEIEIERIVWQVEVLGICDVRGPASIAQALYAETAAGREKRLLELERRKTYREPAAAMHGRPTKRDRRTIDKLSGGD
jgi:ribosome-associated heat shock protein Hsp15